MAVFWVSPFSCVAPVVGRVTFNAEPPLRTGAETRVRVPLVNAAQPPFPDSKPGSGSSCGELFNATMLLLGAEVTLSPSALVAVTVIGEPVPVARMLPGLLVTVYRVMGEPPSDRGVNDTVALAGPALAITP